MKLQFQKPDRKSLIYLGIIAALAVLSAIVILAFYSKIKKEKPIMELPGKTLVERQTEEINRQLKNMKPPSAEEIKKQQEEIQRQLDEINKNK